MNKGFFRVAAVLLLAVVAMSTSVVAEDAPAQPNLDAVLSDLAKIGPDQLIAHVEALKKQIGDLKAEAEAATKRAAELEAQSAAVKAQVETIEKFIGAVAAAYVIEHPGPQPLPYTRQAFAARYRENFGDAPELQDLVEH